MFAMKIYLVCLYRTASYFLQQQYRSGGFSAALHFLVRYNGWRTWCFTYICKAPFIADSIETFMHKIREKKMDYLLTWHIYLSC